MPNQIPPFLRRLPSSPVSSAWRSRLAAPALAVAAALLLAACGQPPGAAEGGRGGMAVPVSVLEAHAEAMPLTLEYTAQMHSARTVEVRARVSGLLMQRHFSEGTRVRKGQLLYTVDPAPYEAAQARAEAVLAAAQARQAQAAREAKRLAQLVETEAVARKDYDDARAAEAIAAADVLAAQAGLRAARLDLSWARIEAPIGGVAGRSLPAEGSLISGPEILLTTVTQTDPLQVLFGIPDSDRLRLARDAAEGRLTLPRDGRYTVELVLADGSTYRQRGRTDFTAVHVSPETGTSEARAEVANPDGLLQPGQFVRVRLGGATRSAVFRIPQRAVLEGPQGRFVYVVDAEGRAAMRPVEAEEWSDGDVVVSKGLEAGAQVIVDGVLKLGPGAPVQATPLQAKGKEAQPGAAAAAAPTAGN